MQTAEFAEFQTMVHRLSKIFGKKVDDEMMQSYWFALKDQQLPVFKKFVERHERYGKFFPKPSELRAKEDKIPEVQGGKDDKSFKEAEARCIANLEELRARDPIAWRKEVETRSIDRIIATQSPGSSMYEAAMNEQRQRRA